MIKEDTIRWWIKMRLVSSFQVMGLRKHQTTEISFFVFKVVVCKESVISTSLMPLCIMCCSFLLEKMDIFLLFHLILDWMENSEVNMSVRDVTMHIGCMSSMLSNCETSLHCSWAQSCFSNLLLMPGLLFNRIY